MNTEMTCIFNCEIGEDLRKEIAEGKLHKYADAAANCELRGTAMLELGYIDIELNINSDVYAENKTVEECTPMLDYFICIKCGEKRTDWESWGYADDLIGNEGHAHIDWNAKDWEEQLFDDMLKSLTKFVRVANSRPGLLPQYQLSFLYVNDGIF